MLLTNWLNSLSSRLRKRPVFRSRDRRALLRHWQQVLNNQISTVEVLEDRTMLTAPLASAIASDVGVAENGQTAYSFTVEYTDDISIDVSTIDINDVTVSGPHDTLTVNSVEVDSGGDGTQRTVTYTVTPPGGYWDIEDNGTYTIALNGSQVGDEGDPQLFAAANSSMATFEVDLNKTNGAYNGPNQLQVGGVDYAPSITDYQVSTTLQESTSTTSQSLDYRYLVIGMVTVDESGVYEVSGEIGIRSLSSSSSQVQYGLVINDEFGESRVTTIPNGFEDKSFELNLEETLQLSVGDTVQLWVREISGDVEVMISSSTPQHRLSLTRLEGVSGISVNESTTYSRQSLSSSFVTVETLTAAESGVYRVTGEIGIQNYSTDTSQLEYRILVNGSQSESRIFNISDNLSYKYFELNLADTLELSAGDTVQLEVREISGIVYLSTSHLAPQHRLRLIRYVGVSGVTTQATGSSDSSALTTSFHTVGTLTAAESGTYRVTGELGVRGLPYWPSPSSPKYFYDDQVEYRFWVNGVVTETRITSIMRALQGSPYELNLEEILDLNAGDTVQLQVRSLGVFYSYTWGAATRRDNVALSTSDYTSQHKLSLTRLGDVPRAMNWEDEGRTVVTNVQSLSGLDVHREIIVPETGDQDFARTIDVFHNPTASAITETVQIVGNLGSDGETVVFNTSDGDSIVEPTDLWIGTDDADGSGTPALIHYIHSVRGLVPATVEIVGDNIVWTYSLTVNAGETVRLAHFTIADEDRADVEAEANALVTSAGFSGEAAKFLTEAELASLQNFQFDQPPIVSASVSQVETTENGLDSYSFTVEFSDDSAVDISTIDVNDVTVTGSYDTLVVTSAVVHSGVDGSPVAVTYTVSPPGGFWDLTDNGTYSIQLNGSEVGDDGSIQLFVAENSSLATFEVNIPSIISQGELLPDPAANPAEGDETGSAVAVDGDWMIVAAESYNNRDGIVYLYVRNDVNQTPDNLTDDTWDFHSTIYAPTNGVEPGYYYFGKSVAIEGNTLIIGASYADDGDLAGSVYLYQLNEGGDPGHEDDVWVHQRTFTQPADGLFGDPYPRGFGPSVSNFGHSLAIQGQTIVVGAPNADVDETAKRAGAVYVFMTDDGWNSYSTSKLTASDATEYAYFGDSVAISEDENTIIAGDPYHSSGDPSGYQDGAVYLFSRDTSGTAIPGDDSWSEFKMLTAVETDSHFGTSVGIENGIAVIGAIGDAYLIQESENWDVFKSLADIGETKPDRFGPGVAISGDMILVGAPVFGDPADPGSVYLFDGWNGWDSPEIKQLFATDPNLNETFFSDTIAISGRTIIAGWHKHTHDGVQTGAAYVYEYQPVIDLKADITDGSLVINNLTDQNTSVSLSVSEGALVVTHPDNRLVPPVGANQVNLNQFTIPLSALSSGEIYINGGTGDERVSVDTSLAAAGLKVIFNGGEGSGFDSLELTGTAGSAEYLFENEHDGKVQLNDSGLDFISYTGLEPITSSIDAAQITLAYSDVDETITVSSPASGQLSVDSTAGEIITFQNFTGKLTLDAGAGINTLNLNDLGASLTADFEILDSAGTETVILGDTLNLGSGKIIIAAETVQIAGAVTGAGDLEIAATTIEFSHANSLLNTGAGDLSLLAENTVDLLEVISSGTVEITVLNGDINDSNDDTNNITASRAILSAVNGTIGNSLETEVGNLEAAAYGNIDITNTGDLIIGGVSGLEGIESTYGQVIIRSFGSMEVQENVSSYTNLLLWTQDSAVASLDEDILVHSGVTLQSETNYVALFSDDDVTVQEQALLQTTAHHIYFYINYESADGVGGVLELYGKLITQSPSYVTFVHGSPQADLYQIAPSLTSRIFVRGYIPWSQTETLDDELIYYVPEGETATLVPSSDVNGAISYTGGYQGIGYSSVAILEQDVLQPQPGHLRVTGTAGNDVLTINAANANSGTWQLNDGPVNSFSNIENFTFVGLEGDDRLVINNPVDGVFHPAGGVDYIGGTGGETLGDTLEIIGGFVADSEFEFLTEDRGRVFYGGLAVPAINYFDLEELVSELSVSEQQLYYNIPATLLSISDAGAGKTAFDTAYGTPLKLETPIETLSLQYGNRPLQGDQYYIHLNSLEAGFDANFVINDRHNNNTVILTDGLHLGSADVTINTERVRVFGSVTGTGDLEIVTATIDFPYANSMLNTGAGDLRLQAETTINLTEVISTGTVEITSLNGDINDSNDSATNITASRAILSAVNGSIGNTLETEIGSLEAVADGSIEISNTGDLILGGIGVLDGVESTGGDVIVETQARLEVHENVTAFNSVTLTTLDSAVASLNEDIVVKSGATIYAEKDEVALYADDDLTVEELAEILAPAYTISLNVNYDSTDGVGGVLNLAGQTTTWSPFYRTLVNGSSQADKFQVAPSLNSLISVLADSPSSPDLIVDSLSYITPEGETGTLVPSNDTFGTISFTAGYRDIHYSGVENLQQADLQQLAGQLRIEGTAGDDVLTINATDANSGTWQLNDGPAVAFSAIHELAFYGLTGDDRLVINNPAGMIFNPTGGILYDAGGQVGDRLELAGGFANSEEHRLVAGQHAVYFNGSAEATIRYLGVSSIVSELDTAETILTGDNLTVASDDGIQTSVTGDGTSVHFAGLTGVLSLQGDTNAATIQLNTLGSGLTGTLNLGGGKQEELILNDGLDLGDRDLTFQAGTVQIAGAVTRTGDLEIEATTIGFTSPDSSLDMGDGNLSLLAENSINLMEIITTGTVEINSINGDIIDNGDTLFSDGNATNITATNVLLSALNGMISSVDTQAGHLEAIADGTISINNTGDLVIGGAGALTGVESLNGMVQIYSYGGIDIQEDIKSWGTSRIQTFDSTESSMSEDIIVRAGTMVLSTYSYVNLAADDDLTIESGSTIAAPNNDIHLRLDYLSSDGAGTVLELAGDLITRESGGLSRVYGSLKTDYLWITPSLNSEIRVYGMAPDAPAVSGDFLFYVIPGEETATLNQSGSRLEFTGGYADIIFSGIENLQQGDLSQLSGQLRIDGTAADDVLTINATNENSGTWQFNSGPEVAFSDITELVFYGLTGDDRLEINHPDGAIFNPTGGILYDAGGQAGDELELAGGTVQSVQHRLVEGQNAIYFNGSPDPTVRYLGVATVIADTNAVAASLVGDTLTVSSNDGVQTRVAGNTAVLFSSYSGLLALEGTSPSATIQLNSLGSGMTGTLLVGGGRQETVILNDGLNLGTADVTIHAGSAQVTGEVTATGDIQIEATTITFADANSGIDAGAGKIELISSEDLIVGNLTTTGAVVLTSLKGDIQRVTTGTSLIKAFSAVMSAKEGNVGYSYQLYTELSHLEVIAFDGAGIRNTGDLTIGGVSDLVGIEVLGGGSVEIYNTGSLQISEDLISLGRLYLRTYDNANPSSTSNLIVDSGVFLQSGSYTYLISCDDLLIEQNALLTSFRIYLYVDVGGGNDTSGGRLDLLGELAVFGGEHAEINGGAQADSFYINPSLRNRIYLNAHDPTSPADTLYYYTPEGVTATLSNSSTTVGTVTFSEAYQEILHVNVETIENAGTPPEPDPAWILVAGTSGNDILTVNATDSNSGTWQLNDGPVVSFDDIESFTFFGLEGDDRLVINNPIDGVFQPAGGINYGGGTGGETLGDTLEIIGGVIEDSEFEFVADNRGRIFYGNGAVPAINHFNLEELSSELSVTNQRIYYSFPGTQPLTISDAGAGVTAFDCLFGTPLKLISPIESLTLQFGNQPLNDYQVNLNSLGTGFSADLIINDRDDNTSITLGDGLHLGSGDVMLNAETVQVAGAVTGEGDLDVVATTIEFLNTNSSLNTGDGDLNLVAENTINLMEVVSTGNVQITVLNGDINDSNDSANNITASRAILSAINGAIGSSLETELGNLEAVAYGGVDITNTGDLIIGGVGGLEGIESTYGRVLVRSYGSMQVTENVSSYTNLLLWTQDSAVASLDEDILVHSGVKLHSETNYVALYADDDLTIEEQVTLETLSSNIYLRVNYQSADGVGGVLNLAGILVTQSPSYRAYLYGSTQADTFWITPSLNSHMSVLADSPANPDLIGDTLYYFLPDGETATPVPSSEANGTLTFTGDYKDIIYNNVETLQQGDLSQLAGQLRIVGTASDDVLTINATDANSGTWQLNSGPEMAFSGINELVFYGLTGDDRLLINNPDGMIFNPAGGILYDAGGQAGDLLELQGGYATSEEHRLVAGQNAVYFNGATEATIRYLGVPTIVSEMDTAETILTGNSLTVSADNGNQTRVAGNASVLVGSFTGTLAVVGETEAATILLNSLGSGMTGTLQVGRDRQETVTLNNGLDLGGSNLIVNAGTVTIDGNVSTTGDVTIHGSTISFTSWNYLIDAGAGNIELQSDGRIIIGGLRTTGDVKITTHDGDILGGASRSITAASAVLISEKAAIRSLSTEIGFLEAYANYGVEVTNLTDLVIGGISDLAGINSLAGEVVVRVFGGLTVKEDIRSTQVRLYTIESVESASEVQNLVIESGVVLQSAEYSSIQLHSSDDLMLEQNSLLSGGDIYLQIGASNLDGEGGRLDLRGQLVERNDFPTVFGGSLADSFYIYPGLDNQIWIAGGEPGTESSPGDTLYYYTPEALTSTDTAGGTIGSGVISYSGGFQNIEYSQMETVINAGVPPVADDAHLQLTGTTGDDVLTINATGAASGTWQLNDGPVNLFSDIESLTFFGLSGDDQLVINHPVDGVFQPSKGINFVGGSAGETLGDTLEIVGGISSETQMEFLFEGVGALYYEGISTPAIRYYDLEEVRNQGTVENLKLNYRSVYSQTLTVNDAGSGLTSIDSNYGTLLTFSSPAEALSVSVESHPNYDPLMNLNSLGEGFHADVTILNVNQNLNVTLADGLNLGSGTVTINGETVQIAGAVTGAGDFEIVATTIGFPNANSSLNTGDGNLSLQAENTINFGEVITTGTVEITSTSGDILDNNDTASNITASQATLSALSGEIYHLETVLERIEMIADGRILVFNTGNLTIGGIGALEGVASVNDRVLVTTIGQMLIQENVTAFDNVLIRTYDSDVVSLNEDIIVKSGVTIQAETYGVSLSAADDLTIEEQATLQSTASSIYLEVNADSPDGTGGVLELYGNVITPGGSTATSLRGSNENDIFWVVPSLTSRIVVSALDPLPPGPVGDELIYYIPEGETALHVAGTDAGTISFSGAYPKLSYNSIESFTLAGSLTLEGTAGDDVLTINATDANSGTFQLNEQPIVAFTDLSDLTFRGLDGDDRLVINHPSEGLFAPLGGVLFEGGGQTTEDTLEIYGGTASSVEHRFINENDGSIFYNGQTTAAITYTGLEPVLDTIAAIDRSFSFTGGTEAITLSDDGDAGDGESQIDSTLGESVVFTNPTGTLTINTEVAGGSGTDNIIVNPVDSTFTANLTINAGNDDSVTLNTIDSGSGNVELNANEVNIDGTLTTSGMVEINASYLIRFAETGVIDAAANTVQLTAGNDIQMGRISTAGNVWLISTGGAILDGTTSENSLIQSDSLFLQAATGIGGTGDADIDIKANHITADSYQGPIMIDNFGDLFIRLSEFPDIILNEDAGEQSINLSLITTAGGSSQPLNVTATSSHPLLIPDPQVNYATGDTLASLVVTPVPEQTGVATVTVVVTDGGVDHQLETTGDNRSIELTFDITVSPQNDAPELDQLDDLLLITSAPEQTVNLSGISAGGGESQPLRVTAQSSNTGLIANPVVNYNSADATGSLVFTPITNQTGTTTITVTVEDGGLDGNLATTADNATITRTFDVSVRELETLSLRVVDTPTATDAQGAAPVLPPNQDSISEWEDYWVEIWVSTEDPASQGIASVALDLSYQTEFTTATSFEYGDAFSLNQTGTINDVTGLVENLSATTAVANLGLTGRLLFARIHFEALADDQVLVDYDQQSIGPHDLALQMQSTEVRLGSGRTSQASIIDSPGADIWANPYDLNDDDRISYRDLILFASVYNSVPAESSSDYSWFSDYNQNQRVDYRDLIYLASNYNKSKLQQQKIVYPGNYPDAWNQQLQVSALPQTEQTAPTLTQPQADSMLQTAVQDVSPTLTTEQQKQLASVKVEVVDLEGTTLGRTGGNTIYIDINAAGYGWFVDETPLDHSEYQYDSQLSLIALPDSEAAGLIDLWTVIRHELGHLLGYEHQDSGVMEATLDPGVRKLSELDEETDLFFASLGEATDLLSF